MSLTDKGIAKVVGHPITPIVLRTIQAIWQARIQTLGILSLAVGNCGTLVLVIIARVIMPILRAVPALDVYGSLGSIVPRRIMNPSIMEDATIAQIRDAHTKARLLTIRSSTYTRQASVRVTR